VGALHADLPRDQEAQWAHFGHIRDPGAQAERLDLRGGSTLPDCIPDKVNGFHYLYEAYLASNPTYTGKVTVPTLWDKKTEKIVNNESSEIIRMLNTEFNAVAGDRTDLYPRDLRAEIDALNERIYHNVNNAYAVRASQNHRPPTRRPMMDCSQRSIGWSSSCRASAICLAAKSQKLTGGCFRRRSASTSLTSRSSGATGSALPTTGASRITCADSTRCQVAR
jgi:hypothetical protein